MSKPKPPTALLTVNGWYLELPGLISPHFENLSGLSKKTGTVEIVDAGTNVKYKFSSQIIDFGQITLSRTLDLSSDDKSFRELVRMSIVDGIKHSGVLVKEHFRVPVFRVAFTGLRFFEENYPDFNINAEDKLLISCAATVDLWELL